MDPQQTQDPTAEPLRIVITADKVEIFGYDRPVLKSGHGFTCRTATHEAIAWAVRRLGEELEASTQFYRTGDWQQDHIEMIEPGTTEEEWKCPT